MGRGERIERVVFAFPRKRESTKVTAGHQNIATKTVSSLPHLLTQKNLFQVITVDNYKNVAR